VSAFALSRLFKLRPKPETLAARDAYELWAPGYPSIAHNPLMRAEQAAVEEALRDAGQFGRDAQVALEEVGRSGEVGQIGQVEAALASPRALDIGTGSGRYLPILAAAGAAHVVGLDFSRAMLARAQADRVDSGAGSGSHSRSSTRICGDARRLPFRGESFDLINASLMAGDIEDLRGFVAGVAAVLAPGGHFIYSDFHPTWTSKGWQRTFKTAGGQHIALPYTPHRLDDHHDALRAAGLRVVSVREPRLNPDEQGADVEAYRRQWGDPPVVVVFHATNDR
jgi:SAM-dependent methyltransferase